MAYKVIVVNGQNWMKEFELPVDDLPWKRVWNTGHQASLSVVLSELDLKPELHRTQLWPLEYWLVVEWDGVPVYAAIITDHDYNWKSRTFTIEYADIWWFWERRHVLSDRTAAAGQFSYDWKNISYETLAIRAVKRGLESATGDLNWGIPISFPAETSGSLDRPVYGYQFETVKELLDEATQAGELNLDFRPRWATDGSLAWTMEFDTAEVVLEYDLDAAVSPVTDLDYSVIGSQLANHVYITGEGSEEDMLVTTSQKPGGSPYPALERVIAGKSVDKLPRLQALVTAERTNHDATIRHCGMKVLADGPPDVGMFRLGSTVRWRTVSDPYLPNVWHEQTLIEFSGSLKQEVVLTMTDWGG